MKFCVQYGRKLAMWIIYLVRCRVCAHATSPPPPPKTFTVMAVGRSMVGSWSAGRVESATSVGMIAAAGEEVLTFSGFCFVRLMALTGGMINWVLPMGYKECTVYYTPVLYVSLSAPAKRQHPPPPPPPLQLPRPGRCNFGKTVRLTPPQ